MAQDEGCGPLVDAPVPTRARRWATSSPSRRRLRRSRSFLETGKNFLGERTVAKSLPRERSLDIDDEFDLKMADLLRVKDVMHRVSALRPIDLAARAGRRRSGAYYGLPTHAAF